MAISAADIAELQRLAATTPDLDGPELSALESVEEVVGWLIASARAEGTTDEADIVEALARCAGLTPNAVRRLARDLAPLGYDKVVARLRQIAGRREHSLAPLS
jgi:hypothetical protein